MVTGNHPLYAELTKSDYADGSPGGDITWNFEKFLVSPEGAVLARWTPTTTPDDPAVVAAIEAALPG